MVVVAVVSLVGGLVGWLVRWFVSEWVSQSVSQSVYSCFAAVAHRSDPLFTCGQTSLVGLFYWGLNTGFKRPNGAGAVCELRTAEEATETLEGVMVVVSWLSLSQTKPEALQRQHLYKSSKQHGSFIEIFVYTTVQASELHIQVVVSWPFHLASSQLLFFIALYLSRFMLASWLDLLLKDMGCRHCRHHPSLKPQEEDVQDPPFRRASVPPPFEVGGVWTFGQLVLFSMLGSKTVTWRVDRWCFFQWT